jgi:hypothetical protein
MAAVAVRWRALARNRTADPILTMDVLCRLSYQGALRGRRVASTPDSVERADVPGALVRLRGGGSRI